MEVLKNYVENIFLPYEKNENSLRLKNDILSHMEDEYYELKNNNISNEEAIGIIISKFGSFEDLLSELKLENKKEELSNEDLEMVSEYIKFSSVFPILIAAGVGFCIMAVAVTGAFSHITKGVLLPAIFFSFVAVGVVLFIIAGIKKSFYIEYFKSKGLTQYYDVDEHGLPTGNPNYRKNKLLLDSIMGVLWLVITGVYLFLGFTRELWHPGWIIFVIGGLLSGIIEIIFNFLNAK
ncbi:hypothetical protein [Miniphocaeibacter massiliensis]|uniref:hypothetical protein n=1 Tax=Miniphocaeibacter massiliensis TaxID=2041841 RepID=UPI000C1BFCF6|nr:hypothetical protein [Miniphocaeibacter massiliensis]